MCSRLLLMILLLLLIVHFTTQGKIRHRCRSALVRRRLARLPMTCSVSRSKSGGIVQVGPHTMITPRVLQAPRNDGHVVECGGVPPLSRKTQRFFPWLRRRSKSGGAPPHSTTQAKLSAATDVFCNSKQGSPILHVISAPKITPAISRILGMTSPSSRNQSFPLSGARS